MKINRMILSVFIIVFTVSCSPQENPVRGVYELKQGPSVPLVTPIWSASGDRITASHVVYTERMSTIYSFDLNTHEYTTLISVDGEAVAQSLSKDGVNMAVAISGSITFSDDGIWVFNLADGTNEYVGFGQAAAWSPDGDLLAIYSCEHLPDGKSSIATVRLVNLSQKEEEVLFSENSCFKLSYMSWSPDNKSIAFSFSKDKLTEKPLDQIFVIDLSTKKVNRILGEGSWSPSFSPDGEKIVFVKNYALGISDKTGTCQIDVEDLGIDIIGDVTWSPDGTKWAVSGLGKIHIINVEQVLKEEFFQVDSLCQ